MRTQKGCIRKNHGAWYALYREDRLVDGEVKRKLVAKKLANVCERYRQESDVKPLLQELMASVNTSKVDAHATMTLRQFVETVWLPTCKKEVALATYENYSGISQRHLLPRLGHMPLRDVRPADVLRMLTDMQNDGVGWRTIRYCKGIGSAIFSKAQVLYGLVNGNPFGGKAVLPKRKGRAKVKSCPTMQTVWNMLHTLTGHPKASAAIGLAYLGGLVPSEISGARWEEYSGVTLLVCRSRYKGVEGETKTAYRSAPIPICEPLRQILEELREADGNPKSGPILREVNRKTRAVVPADLNNLNRRVIAPALHKAGIPWDGYRSLRRAAATDITSAHAGLAAKGLLRHGTVATTDRVYIQTVPAATQNAVDELGRAFLDCGATVEQLLSSTPKEHQLTN